MTTKSYLQRNLESELKQKPQLNTLEGIKGGNDGTTVQKFDLAALHNDHRCYKYVIPPGFGHLC